VHPADIQDRDGGILVMATLFGMFPFLNKLFADGGYQGPKFANALAKCLPHLTVEIVKRPADAVGFKIVPKRWIVERSIAWLNRCRRLAKDWENLNRKALARRPDQLAPIAGLSGWHIDVSAMAEIDRILSETIVDAVGPEFMAPPDRLAA